MRRTAALFLAALALPATVAHADGPDDDGVAAVDFGEWEWDAVDDAPAPMSLTASDGTGLQLTTLQAHVVVQGPLAFTELRLAFHNPEQRVREGRFEITLPDGAAISRFAMKIGEQWQEGEVVEQTLARRAYEDFLHRRQDPALLEHDAGNQFRARVFPIGAGEDKELVLSYSQELASVDGLYRLPTAGLPSLDNFDVEVSIDTVGRSRETLSLHRRGEAPEGDVVVATNGPVAQIGVQHEDLVMARVVPRLREEPVAMNDLTVLFDTSASRTLSLDSDVERLAGVLQQLSRTHGDVPVRVVAFDQTTETVFEGPASGFGRQAQTRLRQRGAFGASNLSRALAEVGGAERVLLVTDGVATAGEDEPERLGALVRNAGNRGVGRIDVLTSGGIRDLAGLEGLVRGLPTGGTVIDGDVSVRDAAHRLSLAVYDLDVSVPGADWVWPTQLAGVQPGEARTVFAKLPNGSFDVLLGGQSVGPIAMDDVPRPLLEREWVQARMQRLEAMAQEASDPDEAAAYRGQVTTLSTEHRVLTDTTSLLVLETEADYARFGIDRNALADVLTVRDGDIASVQRQGRVGPSVVEGMMPVPALRGDFDDRMPAQDISGADVASTDAFAGAPAAAPMGDADLLADVPMMGPTEELQRVVSAEVAQTTGQGTTGATTGRRRSPRVAEPMPSFDAGEAVEDEIEEPVDAMPRLNDSIATRTGTPAPARLTASQARERLATDPGNVLALLALSERLAEAGETERAARVVGSIIDLFPSRADMRRMAGQRLDALQTDAAMTLALDTYEVALQQRPDHPSSHRQVALSRLRRGDVEGAFDALEASLMRAYPDGRFAGVDRLMREDLGLVAAAWIAQDPSVQADVERRLTGVGARVAQDPSLRFVITWETDANDVDLHVYDGKGHHAWYSEKQMPSGGELFADVTTGFGPECFAVNAPSSGPYRVQAHYYRQGPMGYGMGTLHVIRHDGKGEVSIEDRPFVVEQDGAWLELGTYAAR